MPTSFELSEELEDGVDSLVESGWYMSKSEVIRDAIRRQLEYLQHSGGK